jgi:autoinducer 2-degrading protein
LPWRGSWCDYRALQNKIQKGQFAMLVVHVELCIDPAQLDQFLPLMQDKARDSLALEPGCHQFDVAQDPHNPASIMLYERYKDAAAFDAHKAMPHYMAFIAATDSMITSQTVRQWQRIYA